MSSAVKHPRFRTLDSDALNGGVLPVEQVGQFLTPTANLFTRSHAPIPRIAAAEWGIRVHGLVERPAEFLVGELESRFAMREVVATMICAGLRREEFLQLGPLPGELPWAGEPIGTSRWQGVALQDVLDTVGVHPDARQVAFTGGDSVERHGERFGFGGSITLAKARQPDVLLATRLEGQPLPEAHGFPIRMVVPGWYGARSIKWLREIELRSEPSTNYFQAKAYRVQRTANPADPRDVTAGIALAEVVLNSAIQSPGPGAALRQGPCVVTGWAIGPEATAPSRVELSSDGGSTWTAATIENGEGRWTWRLWTARIELRPGRHELMVRAWDHQGRGQPASLEETWNVKGYANNAWHRVAVVVTA